MSIKVGDRVRHRLGDEGDAATVIAIDGDAAWLNGDGLRYTATVAYLTPIDAPAPELLTGAQVAQGLALRDWFAGQALAGRNVSRSYKSWADMAADCYDAADAMLAERERDQ